jgi:hypothetical protein
MEWQQIALFCTAVAARKRVTELLRTFIVVRLDHPVDHLAVQLAPPS